MKKSKKVSVAEKIMKIIDKRPKSAEEIKKGLKDRFGFNIKSEDIRVNLLYLLRRGKIYRKKEGSVYKYHI
jgi:DNA replicative helicase MCM subunit Mcm2 (Cdc46/Mcm family)